MHLGVLCQKNAKSVKRMRKTQNEQNFGLLVVTCVSSNMEKGPMRMLNVVGAMGVFTRCVLSIPSGKSLDKNCESLYC